MKSLRFIAPLVVGLALAAPAAANEAADAAGAKAEVVKLGKISPNSPYRLWTAVNNVLPGYALSKGGRGLKSRVEGLTAFSFEGRTPGDVMAKTVEYRANLERLRTQLKLPEVMTYKDPLGRAVTPGVVFVNAGYIMDATVQAFYVAANKPADTTGAVYDVPVAKGKSPSDVYGLVDLANRRLQLIAGS